MNNEYKGNRWYKCDLHLHTPASACFNMESLAVEQFTEQFKEKFVEQFKEQFEEKFSEQFVEQFIDKVIENDIDCIAITDHNTAKYVDKIKKIAEKKSIIVFPGFEVTCSDSQVHLLILFEIDYYKEKIEDFLIKINIKREQFGEKGIQSNKTISEVLELANEEGALVIPAHIDDHNGVSIVAEKLRTEFLESKNINVVQMVNEELITNTKDLDDKEIKQVLERKYGNSVNIKNVISCNEKIKELRIGILTFSDNPSGKGESKHGLWGIGKQYSYIKMSESPTLESLRQAFLSPQNRIKNYYESKQNNIKLPQLWIKKITIKNIELLDKEEALEINFNPQLTTIIGGRGSGKSTVVRFLTAVFAKSSIEKLREIYEEFTSFYQLKNRGVGVLKQETTIDVELVKNNVSYKVSLSNFKTANEYEVKIKKYNLEINNFEEITGISPEELFNIDIYNQKQIYELSKNTNYFREKIDSLISEIDNIKKEAERFVVEYKKQYANIVEVEDKIKNKKKVELELEDIKEKIDTYKMSGINDVIEKFKLLKSQKVFVFQQQEELKSKKEKLDKIVSEFELELIDKNVFDGEYKEEILGIINKKNLEYKKLIKIVHDASKNIDKLRDTYVKEIESSDFYINYNEVEKEYNNRLKSLKDKGIDIDEIDTLIEKSQKKYKELDEIKKDEKVLKDKYESLNKIRKEYISKRNEISNLRQKYLKDLLKDTNIMLKVNRFRDIENFEFEFRKIIKKQKSFDEDINKIIKEITKGVIEKNIDNLAEEFKRIKNNGKNNDSLYSGRFNTLIKELNNKQISDISMLIPEDYIEIKYKSSGSNEYKSLKNASAGQKTSAILTFILSYGDTPLILDQPEDDLDNHLIYDLVVERLKVSKEKRQIIVVTHNANIPVNGDAEFIIAMDSSSKYVKVYKSGNIEDNELRKEICNVMEGGEKAFSMRANRYKIEKL